ncbi:TonB-dependent receptor [Sphingomonas sp.]|uniref:TonB-dependent receptor n=1 Tax=Sphingomonas sp. TaxID=28214 RepID=UPI001EB28C68|nr:TonB-dependent receptor [Sphingomonas sp.]MBX3594360.1 TonB-dependent receptor [Sphingomonas sp.]
MIFKMSKLGFVAGAVLLSTTSAMAQAVSAPAPAADDEPQAGGGESGDGNDIIVTAQRRSERLQDVPLAVSAFSSEDLETRQVSNTLDLVNYVPNLIGHNNTALGTANTYSLRGLANTESISTFDPPVGTYVDDIYISRQGANNFSFFDVERVEVLRGPQGTLFGRNTTGGAINVILRKPSDQYTGYVDAGYGRFNRFQMRASVDVPMSEKLLTKFSGYYNRADGYVQDLVTGEKLNGEKSWGLRGAVRALLSDSVTWDLTASQSYSAIANLPNFYDAQNDRRISYTPLRTDQGLGTALASAGLADIPLGNRTWSTLVSSNFEVAVDDSLTLNFITGYSYLRQKYMTDSFAGLSSASVVFDGVKFISGSRGTSTPLVNDSWSKQFSQEIKLTGNAFGDLLTYVAGIYYVNERNYTNFANISLPLAGVSAARVSGDRVMRNDTEAYAGYFQGDFHLTPELTFTAGIRYTDENKTISFSPNASPLARSSAINQPFDTQDLVTAGIPVELKSKVWTPRFALNYKLTPDVMLFASATKGFKSGGWNSRAYYAAGAAAFTKETIWSYEAGLRSEFFDRMLKVNLTGFYFMDYDAQLPGGGYNPVTNTITYLTRNVADMENYGLEGEIALNPTRALSLFWNFGLQKARYTNLNQATKDQIARCLGGTYANNCNTGIVTPTGAVGEPTRAPRFTSTLGANYDFDLGGGLSLKPSVNWAYVSGTWVSTSNDAAGFQPAHSLFNGGLTLASDSGWSLGVECSNCFNKVYKTSFLIYPYLSNPGSWIVRARYKF